MNDGLTKEEKTAIYKQAMKDGKRFEYLCEMGVNYELAEALCWKTHDDFVSLSKRFSLDHIELVFEALAAIDYDGHYTLLRFTSGYKAAFGTPDLRSDLGAGEVAALDSFPKAKGAMVWAIANNASFY